MVTPDEQGNTAESRQQEASTSGDFVPEEIQKYVQEQTELYNRLEALADKPVRVRRWKIMCVFPDRSLKSVAQND